MKKRLLTLLTFCLVSILCWAQKTAVIEVQTQGEFDGLDTQIKQVLKTGISDIEIQLQTGIYYYGEKHLDFSSLNYPKASITIMGEGSYLIGKDLGAARSWQDGTFRATMLQDVDRWSAFEQSPSMVEVVDRQAKMCRIRVPYKQKAQNEMKCEGQYLQLTEWYDSKVYPVIRRDKKYIYFYAPDLKYSQSFGEWNVNYDLVYGHVTPRYRTIDQKVTSEEVTFCQSSTFLNLWHSKLGRVTLQGIVFGPNNGRAPLIDTDMLECESLQVTSCIFRGVRGLVAKVWHTDNVQIHANTFEGCYAGVIESYNGSAKTEVSNNEFLDHGRGMRQNFAIICRGEDFLIKNNSFRNFNYAAIGVGLWYGHQKKGPVTGQVVGNDIAYDQEYYNQYQQHTLMDGGAIYAWTICDKVEIIGNTINRYRGVKDYRGIFCDDGAKNITVRNNTVTNIGDNCWCIDLRWVDHVSEKVPDHNTGNVVSDNQVDGRIRFETKRP